ncbi:MAG: 30S ribosomal protein S7 [Planctomycetota bacterium]|jgi:small subunit ribosomal protein S7
MPRKFKSLEHLLKPDPKLNSKLVAKFINYIMQDGRKTTAQRTFYNAMTLLGRKFRDVDPLEVFTMAINHVKPQVEVRSKRVGGATYQVPMEVGRGRQQSLAFRWILDAARKKKGRPMAHRLADELADAYKKEGVAIKQRENVHRMAEANKAFAHFAW